MAIIDRNFFIKKYSNNESKIFISKIIDKIEYSIRKHQAVFTDFINPNERLILIDILKEISDIEYIIFGGTNDTERNIVCFYPDYMTIENKDFPIKAIKITRNLKFSKNLSHRDYLGSIIGLGIERSKIGDIIIFDDYTLCFVCESIADYISLNINKVGNTNINTEVLDITNIDIPKKQLLTKKVTVSSLRLDSIISAALNISRGKSQEIIKSEKVNINWCLVSNTSYIVNENDIISVRGKGRFVISELLGKTKKDRIVIVFSMYV